MYENCISSHGSFTDDFLKELIETITFAYQELSKTKELDICARGTRDDRKIKFHFGDKYSINIGKAVYYRENSHTYFSSTEDVSMTVPLSEEEIKLFFKAACRVQIHHS